MWMLVHMCARVICFPRTYVRVIRIYRRGVARHNGKNPRNSQHFRPTDRVVGLIPTDRLTDPSDKLGTAP
jgi:hypothetical protein